jgi:hypothetical protein
VTSDTQTPEPVPVPPPAGPKPAASTPRPGAPFRVVLQALPDAVPARVRVRRLLKLALRAFRLKCVRVELVQAEPGPAVGAEQRAPVVEVDSAVR